MSRHGHAANTFVEKYIRFLIFTVTYVGLFVLDEDVAEKNAQAKTEAVHCLRAHVTESANQYVLRTFSSL